MSGAARKSWQVTRLTVHPISEEDLKRLQDIAPEMFEQLSKLTHIGILQDLTNEQAQQDYRLPVKPKLPGKALQAFRHQRNPVSKAKAIYFDPPKPQRSESRFKYQTTIELHHPDFPPVTGTTIDFSIRGLNLDISQPLPIKRGDEVTIKFVDLLKLDKNASISQVPYKIVRVSPDFSNIQLTTGSGESAFKGGAVLAPPNSAQ